MQRKPFCCVIWAMSALAWALGVAAADYPDKPVRMIVGFPAGSGVDILARLAGQKLAETYGQQFVIDNRPGAGSNIAANLAAKAAPDGYTIFLGTVANAMLFAISSSAKRLRCRTCVNNSPYKASM
jgi:tripartite-type tricarboxylate transporter receptor subunit TctC